MLTHCNIASVMQVFFYCGTYFFFGASLHTVEGLTLVTKLYGPICHDFFNQSFHSPSSSPNLRPLSPISVHTNCSSPADLPATPCAGAPPAAPRPRLRRTWRPLPLRLGRALRPLRRCRAPRPFRRTEAPPCGGRVLAPWSGSPAANTSPRRDPAHILQPTPSTGRDRRPASPAAGTSLSSMRRRPSGGQAPARSRQSYTPFLCRRR
jgi:hypothetical protein